MTRKSAHKRPPSVSANGSRSGHSKGKAAKESGGAGLDRSAWLLIFFTPIVIASAVGYYRYQEYLRDLVRTPLDSPKMVPEGSSSAIQDPERFWGTYRPNVYFGLKTRSKQSPVVGLMWMTEFTGEMPPSIRHWCEQGDQLPMYTWFIHDGVNFGHQELMDRYFTVSTDFVKRPGGLHGGDWTARVALKPRVGAEHAIATLYFYAALDGVGSLEPEVSGGHRLKSIRGSTPDLGDFKITFPKPASGVIKTHYLSTHASDLDMLKETLMAGLRIAEWGQKDRQYVALGGHLPQREGGPNFVVHQVTVSLPFEMEVLFESGSFMDRPNTLAKEVYVQTISNYTAAYDNRLEEVFSLYSKGFSNDQIGYARAALSNMLGGIGYFYGSSKVSSEYTTEGPLDYWPAPLYTAVPSRSFFPRGFLWDEGFHNMLISKWDMKISKDIIAHWLDLMNVEGWIPREQILGTEARAKVPAEFVVQHNKNANPPTLFLPLQRIVKQLIASEDPKDREYLKNLFPRLKQWFNWFNTTQLGPKPFTYVWRGRDSTTNRELNPKTLTSGLDDFPRASHPTAKEYHLDLRCWMALAAGVMADIGKSLNESWQEYDTTYRLLTDNDLLDKLHWSPEKQMYADYGLHSRSVKLERPPPPKNLQPGQRPPPPREKERVTKITPQYKFVESFGYVSLFPFLLKFIDPESIKLGKVLSDIRDPNLIWTKYGLRSLAKSDPVYNKYNTEHDPPYWRGAIWINMNYLAVGALHHYSQTPGPHQQTAAELYQDLRTNLIDNILSNWKQTGYIWENYDDVTGKGKGSHPFTGWSALVVAIMAEDY